MLTASRAEVSVCCPFTLKKIKEAKNPATKFKARAYNYLANQGAPVLTKEFHMGLL